MPLLRGLAERRRRSASGGTAGLLPSVEIAWLALLLAYPYLFAGYGISLGIHILVFALLALSLDLSWGVAGIISIGHAAFFGVGAYAVGVLNANHGVQNGFALLALAVVAAALVAGLVAVFLFTGRGDVGLWYTALATIALSYAAQQLVAGTSVLGADTGIPYVDVHLPFVSEYGTATSFYALLVVVVVTYLAVRATLATRVGLLLRALRDDPERLAYLGYRASVHKVAAFTASGAIAGLGGGLLAITDGFVAPTVLGVALSTQALLWVLIGGPGFLIGAVAGAGILEFASFRLSQAYQTGWQIALGLLVVAFVTLAPNGLLGMIERAWRTLGDRSRMRRGGRRAPAAAE